MSEFKLKPSKLSTAANQVWSESTSLFQKKTDVKIDLGLDKPGSIINGGSGSKESTGIALGYVFGSRLVDRILKSDENGGEKAPDSVFGSSNLLSGSIAPSADSKEQASTKSVDVSSIFKRMAEKKKENGSSVNLWKNAQINATSNTVEDPNKTTEEPFDSNANSASTSSEDRLKASAVELAKQSVVGGDLNSTAVEPITTGEEDEKNVINISCKFFYFNVQTKTWVERGLGTLKINEKNNSCDTFRIVGRTIGSQRVVINSKIFPGMILEQITEKRIKISAHTPESETPQLFLIQASPASISRVQFLLEKYILSAKVAEERQNKSGDADSKIDHTNRKRKPQEDLDWNEDWE